MRLATFNIMSGRSLADDQVDADRIRDSVAALDADVLALRGSTISNLAVTTWT